MGVSFCFTVRSVDTKGEAGDTQKEMAQTGRVIQNCVYAPNPYHECTEACLQRIKETKPGKSTKNRKSSDYRRSVTDGELGKKMNEGKRRPSSGCPKASNPYHVCDDNCQKRMTGADPGTMSLNFDRKKKVGSKPELPVLDSIPPSKIGAIYLSDASSPLSSYSEHTKGDSKRNELIPVSGEIHVLDVMPTNNKVQPKQNGDKNASQKVVPITSVYEMGGLTKPDGGSMKFCFSGALHDNEDSDEETESVVSEARVPVGKYHVKESFAPILRSIFEKYGDIGASCHLESVVMRSYYVECVCFVVQELQSTPIMELTKSKIKELLAIIKDVESAQLRVAWLRSIVDEIADSMELIDEQQVAEMAKANSDREVETLNKELESNLESLSQKEQEVTDIKTRIEEIRKRLSELQLRSSDLDKNIMLLRSKVDHLDSKSFLDGLV
ncbi:hypothetical protein LR48_Vigan02g254700 [Vigna angularis]|uniref:Uncharacterized protein n=3 Tax=Phaseolus angularis TaxID=3914 RepID=A0A0L9U132_PHAAN|nr:uncharacterized protein LOC108326548 isoform X1 [Vigna angularis]KAG2401125.1 uncharacterized protein HKW66_Vig0198390 [Vigna angularis]KOM36397.1 hypothetical protein LR48_Vigan02g254700 [Vigna angularis]BAT93688.1 hypothetical protein VIGAN_08021400 [Vigna angularis var. angularis]